MTPQSNRPGREAFSFVEVLIVLSLISISFLVFSPCLQPSLHSRLHAAAHIVAADVHYVRKLAIAKQAPYSLTFEPLANQYVIEHFGEGEEAAELLPPTSFFENRMRSDGKPQQISRVSTRGAKPEVSLVDVTWASDAVSGRNLTFGPDGKLREGSESSIWLAAGHGAARRWIAIRVSEQGEVQVEPVRVTRPLP